MMSSLTIVRSVTYQMRSRCMINGRHVTVCHTTGVRPQRYSSDVLSITSISTVDSTLRRCSSHVHPHSLTQERRREAQKQGEPRGGGASAHGDARSRTGSSSGHVTHSAHAVDIWLYIQYYWDDLAQTCCLGPLALRCYYLLSLHLIHVTHALTNR